MAILSISEIKQELLSDFSDHALSNGIYMLGDINIVPV